MHHASQNFVQGPIVIHTDSLSAIQTLAQRYPTENKRLIGDIYQYTETLHRPIILNWVPSHVGLEGNEMADRAATKAILDPDREILDNQPTRDQIKNSIQHFHKHAWMQVLEEASERSQSLWMAYNLEFREDASANTDTCRRFVGTQVHALRTNSHPSWSTPGDEIQEHYSVSDDCHYCNQSYNTSHTAHYLTECVARPEDTQRLFLALSHYQRETADTSEEVAIRILAAESRRDYLYLGPILLRSPYCPPKVYGDNYLRPR